MDGAAVLQVAKEGDGNAGDGAEFFADGKQVEEGLGRVFEGTIPAIDDGHGREFLGSSGATFFRMTKDYSVCITT